MLLDCKICRKTPEEMLGCKTVIILTNRQAENPEIPCNLPMSEWKKVINPESRPKLVDDDKNRAWPPVVGVSSTKKRGQS